MSWGKGFDISTAWGGDDSAGPTPVPIDANKAGFLSGVPRTGHGDPIRETSIGPLLKVCPSTIVKQENEKLYTRSVGDLDNSAHWHARCIRGHRGQVRVIGSTVERYRSGGTRSVEPQWNPGLRVRRGSYRTKDAGAPAHPGGYAPAAPVRLSVLSAPICDLRQTANTKAGSGEERALQPAIRRCSSLAPTGRRALVLSSEVCMSAGESVLVET